MDEVAFSTSGSSGAAKTVSRTEKSLRADAKALVAAFPQIWAERTPIVASVPADHMYGALWRVRAPEEAGSPVEPETAISCEQLSACKGKYGRFVLVTTPSFLEKLVDMPDARALKGAVKAIVTSGSLLREETSNAALETFGVSPLEIFGSTEAGTVAYRSRAQDGELWNMFPGVEGREGEGGRLEIASPHAMRERLEMSDAVSFASKRRFRLLGRTDRMVKILEEFVSLPAIEQAFESHPFVSRCRAEAMDGDVARIGALAVLSADGMNALAEQTHSSLAALLRRELIGKTGRTAFPRRMRFVRALPSDERGKLTSRDAKAALAAWCKEPAVLSWRADTSTLEATIAFPPDCECFSGHFPQMPILPGVAQLYFLHHFAKQAFADFPDAAAYRRLKFQKIATPREKLLLSVSRKAQGCFSFSLTGPNGICASGAAERNGI
ncbi:MAG: AMP-binding protein [Kiritimatiellae bacterium]|nr:AMP-binding protein [Kiritimatiellia bacterium]